MRLPVNIFKQLFEYDLKLDIQNFQFVDKDYPGNILLNGYGYFEYSKSRQIRFTLYFFPELGETVIEETIHDYFQNKSKYRIKIVDIAGQNWETELSDTTLNTNDAPSAISYISGNCKHLSHIGHSDYKDNDCYISMYFDPKYEFPFNSSDRRSTQNSKGVTVSDKVTPEIDFDGTNLKVRGGNYGTHINIVFVLPSYTENVEFRLLECLRFITGQRIEYTLLEIHTDGDCLSKIFPTDDQVVSSIYPPIWIQEYPVEYATQSWTLCDLMFRHIRELSTKTFSILGTHINAVIGSGPSYFESQTLILAVHIEGIIKDFLLDKVEVGQDVIGSAEVYKEAILKIDPESATEKRLLDFLTTFPKPSVRQVIELLISENVLIRKHQKTWTKVRNKYAHPGLKGRKKSHSNLFNQYFEILDMYYRVIFYILKYEGGYSD
ncbi:MAG: hypothetical protein IIB95_11425, partial [Candidatus Marinimicrobia bacterium]|nr:hypothetical protein [Candidatus Neomarinimicrobiota bacterium]